MKKIPLTQGKFAIVDDEDFERVSQYKWYSKAYKNKLYAARGLKIKGKTKTVLMHRFILDLSFGDVKQIDHINHNGLDNRRCNLRVCSCQQNQYNQKCIRGTSKYKGVYFNKQINKWIAGIRVGGKRKALGSFNLELEAAKAYDEAAVKYHGEFASTNRRYSFK